MSYEFFLARRYLLSQRHGIFALLTTVIAIGGTALGVAALIITLSVMDGFRNDIQEKILGTQPHLIVLSPDGQSPITLQPDLVELLKKKPDVVAIAPFIQSQVLFSGNGPVSGGILRGIDPQMETQVTRLQSILKRGKWEDLASKGGVILGAELAYHLNVGVGETLEIVPPETTERPDAERNFIKLPVVGVFQSGMYDYDAHLAYVSLGKAQKILKLRATQVSGIGLKVRDPQTVQRVSKPLQSELGPSLWVRSWVDMNRNLFSAMKLEKTVMFLILTLIILVASFTIISNLLLLTVEKSRDIGILKALGATQKNIRVIFLWLGFFLGGIGTLLGLALGSAISAALARWPIIKLPADVYYVDTLPVQLTLGNLAQVGICAFLLVLVATLYPAYKASKVDPVEAIRYG